MKNDYTIYIEEERSRLGVYLVPQGVKMTSNSLFKIRVGFIDLDEDPLVFHCLDSDRMTIEVMESIISSWRQWEVSRKTCPI